MNGPDDKLIETNPPTGVLFKVWWGIIWRMFLWLLPLFVLIAFFEDKGLTDFTGEAGELPDLEAGWSDFVTTLCTFAVMLPIFRQLTGKVFGGYRLVFLAPPEAMREKNEPLVNLRPSFGTLLSLTWSNLWRSWLWGILVVVLCLILSFPATFLIAALDLGPAGAVVLMTAGVVALVVGASIFIQIKVLRGLLGKNFNGYRFVFLTPQSAAPDSAPPPAEPPPPRVSDSAHPDSV